MVDLLWIWTDDDEHQWQTCQEGIHLMFSRWCDMAAETAILDSQICAVLPSDLDPKTWFRSHLEAYRPVFCGSPRDTGNANAARRVGFSHIRAHVFPSWYVGLYNLLFSTYHDIVNAPSHPPVPRMLTVRRRWINDVKITLDTYDVALNSQIRQLNDIALTDPLTGLFNRRGFWSRVTLDIDHKLSSAAFVLMDLDRFKDINDSNGHPYGDHLLRAFGHLQQSLGRTGDAFGRLGGDEFAWWVVDIPSIHPLLERLKSLAELLLKEHQVKFSAGIAWYPQNGTDPDSLYHAADTALYRAKDAGRFCCVMADGEIPYRFDIFPTQSLGPQ